MAIVIGLMICSNTILVSAAESSALIIHQTPFEYPREAAKNNWEGKVTLLISITNKGNVSEVIIQKSSGYEILDDAAKDNVKKWRFIPARNQDNQSIASEMPLDVSFYLK
jgi:protein TonB